MRDGGEGTQGRRGGEEEMRLSKVEVEDVCMMEWGRSDVFSSSRGKAIEGRGRGESRWQRIA